jgi:transposase
VEGNVETLAREIEQLRQENAALAHERSELLKRVAILDEKIAWFKQRFFARSSEALSEADQRQLRLFNETDSSPQKTSTEQPDEELVRIPEHVRGKAKRRPLPEDLPREEIVIDIPEEQKHCQCGAELVRIGEEVSEKLDVIPPQLRVIRTVRPQYACHRCEGSADEQKPAVRIAPMPAAIIDKGIASAGMLAYIVASKFCDYLPLYRQEKQFQRIGVELSRRTMADWMIAVSEACAPLMAVMERRVRSGPILQLDETTVQVLDEPGRANTSTSYMWAARGGVPGQPIILYHYAPSRATEVAKQMLGGFEGYLQTDGYEVYDRISETTDNVVHVGCWAHARRKFFEAQKSSKKGGSAEVALSMIGKLYRAEGIGYTQAQWPKLIRYLDHPALTPDTNAIENAIRPFVLGRKNWLFSGSPRGAESSARLYSIIETAKANGHEPYWYLRKLFEGLPTARSEEDLLRLAPFRPSNS